MAERVSHSVLSFDHIRNWLEQEESDGLGSRWEHFPYGSSVGVRGIGPTVESAFERAGLALTAVTADPDSIATRKWIDVTCKAPNAEAMFVDWIDVLVREMAHRKMIFNRFHVHLRDGKLTARVGGQNIDRGKQKPTIKVKGATHTCLKVNEEDGQWMAQCVVDV